MASNIQSPDQGSNLGPLHWELEVLANGPQGSASGQFEEHFESQCFLYLNKTTHLFRNAEEVCLLESQVTLTPDLQGRATGDVGREGPSEDKRKSALASASSDSQRQPSCNSPWAAVLEKECRE